MDITAYQKQSEKKFLGKRIGYFWGILVTLQLCPNLLDILD